MHALTGRTCNMLNEYSSKFWQANGLEITCSHPFVKVEKLKYLGTHHNEGLGVRTIHLQQNHHQLSGLQSREDVNSAIATSYVVSYQHPP